MRAESFQEISDDIFIEKLASDLEIVKMAGLFETLGLGDAVSKIKSLVQEHVGGLSSKDEAIDTVSDLLITGTLFKIHPVLGFGYAVAEALGVDVKAMVGSVVDAIRNKGGEALSEAEFNSIAKSAMESPTLLIKEAQYRGHNSPTIPMFGGWIGKGRGKPNVIARIFGNLFRRGKMFKASWLAKGLIMLVVKTAFLGAGLMVAGGALVGAGKGAVDYVAGPSSEEPGTVEPTASEAQPVAYRGQPTKKVTNWENRMLRTRPGFNNQKWSNDDENAWIIDLNPGNGTIEGTLLAWAVDIYPELAKFRQIIPSFPAFSNTVGILRNNYSSRTPDALLVPTQFTSRKQIVDTFAKDVAKNIAGQISRQIG